MSLENSEIDELLDELTVDVEPVEDAMAQLPAPQPRRDIPKMLRKIRVTLTLEVGSADIALDQLMNLEHSSVVELDTLAGTPLVMKVNGTEIGKAEVVVSGENYGLKVVELADLNLLALDGSA